MVDSKYKAIAGAYQQVVKTHATQKVALFMSGGLDSQALLFELLRQGKDVSIYSFSAKGVWSQDVSYAKFTADAFGVPFTWIQLDMRDRVLIKYIQRARAFGLNKKSEFECVYPFYIALPMVKEKLVFVGHQADGLFGMGKKIEMHHKQHMDAIRLATFTSADNGQANILVPMGKKYGIRVDYPYRDYRFFTAFKGLSWDALNKPRQKEPIHQIYAKELARSKHDRHLNFQLGDSGIASGFYKTFMRHNDGSHNSIITWYRNV